MLCVAPTRPGTIMAKRKKGSKVQGRAKLRRANSAKRSKVRKAAKAAKRTVAKAKPKRAPVKKAARKVKRPVAPVVETVVEMVEQPAPSVITITGVEETEVRKAKLTPLGDLTATLRKLAHSKRTGSSCPFSASLTNSYPSSFS